MGQELEQLFGQQKAAPQAAPSPQPKQAAAPVAEAKAEASPPVETAAAATSEVEATATHETPEEAQGAEARPRDEKGRYVPLQSLHEERNKRKDEQKRSRELEQQLAQLRGRLEATERYAQPSPAAQPIDPDTQFWQSPTGFVAEQIKAKEAEFQRRFLDMSEMMVRDQHSDFDEALESFQDAARSAPHLIAQMRANPHPAKFVYETGKTYAKAKEVGSIEELEARIRADERAKVTAELRKESALSAAENIPKTIAGARGNGVEGRPVWGGPKPVTKIFPGY